MADALLCSLTHLLRASFRWSRACDQPLGPGGCCLGPVLATGPGHHAMRSHAVSEGSVSSGAVGWWGGDAACCDSEFGGGARRRGSELGGEQPAGTGWQLLGPGTRDAA